jgi:hypothetical protein
MITSSKNVLKDWMSKQRSSGVTEGPIVDPDSG